MHLQDGKEARRAPGRWPGLAPDWLHQGWSQWQSLRSWHASRRMIDRFVSELDRVGIFAPSDNILELCQRLAAWRQRPLHLVPYPLPPSMAALVVARQQEDVIFFSEHLPPLLGQHAILHEVSHLVLGHVQPDADAPAPPEELVSEVLTEEDLVQGRQRTLFHARHEREAEWMAYHLRLRWQDACPPQPLRTGHGQDQDIWNRWVAQFHPDPGSV